ncbi:WbqC family protein [Polaromonas sp.]|uniref:WbqC family protein n=1 Tax=Polaromonas sp. TaxID=1869339 RepID=UPI0032632F05
MSKTVVIHQPDFMPYLGFFHRFLEADLFVVLDHVQFVNGTSRSWTHRDKIKTPQGEKWLTLSVKKAPRDTPINRVELSDTVDWAGENLDLLARNYRKAPFYEDIMPQVEALYKAPAHLLGEFNLRSIEMLMDMLDVRIPLVLSSTLEPVGHKNQLLVDLLGKVGATRYLSGTGARDYMEPPLFEAAGITVVWQDFAHPIYPQQFEGFTPYLSALDALFNCGVDGARELLRRKP